MEKLSTNYSWELNGKRDVVKMRKIISIVLSLAFTILLIPQLGLPTSAASNATTIDVGDSSPASLPAGVSYNSGVYTIGVGAEDTSITVAGTTSVNTINVAAGVSGLTLNLDGVSITSGTASPIKIGDASASKSTGVKLHLNDGKASELHANGTGIAGIQSAGVLTITGTTGSLAVTGFDNGIYGGTDTGIVEVRGGSIRTTGGAYGISAGALNVCDGMMTAAGGNAGIYGGRLINICGGTVNATGNDGFYVGDAINISGGTITASGGSKAMNLTNILFPNLSNGEAVTVASLNLDGSSPITYTAGYSSNYKYLKIEVPQNSTIDKTTAIFDKYTGSTDYKDIDTTQTLNGNMLSGIWNGTTKLVQNTDYTVSGTKVTILKAYMASVSAGATTLTFKFSAGSDQTLTVMVSDTTPSNSTINPTTAIFDKYTGSADYKDIDTTQTLNGNMLNGIWNGTTKLVQNTDYTVSGTTVTILKSYLASVSAGATTLTFKFSAGSDQTLVVTVNNTTPSPTVGGGNGGSNKPTVTTTTAGTGTAAVTTVSTEVTGTASSGSKTVTVPKETVTGLTNAAEKAERTGGIAIARIDTGAATGRSQVGVTIPGASFDEFAAGTKAALQINAGLGSVTFSADAVDKIGAAGSGDVTFGIGTVDNKSLSTAMQKLVGSRPVYSFSVTVGNLKVSEFGSSVTVTLPYTLAAKEDPNAIVVYYIDASGALITMQGKCDAKTGSVTFKTTHFSEYMIGYNKADFTDVSSSAWYDDAVTFLAARGITSGTSDGVFSPDAALTRGQFIVMLLRAYGMSADTNPTDNFADAGNTYYTGYIAAAKRMGITSGVGDNKFAPDKAITRQEMFTLLYNTLKTMGQLPATDSGKKLSGFSDAGQVDEWATGAIASLVKAGIVSGNGGNLAPMSMTTRAEMAQVLYNILKQ